MQKFLVLAAISFSKHLVKWSLKMPYERFGFNSATNVEAVLPKNKAKECISYKLKAYDNHAFPVTAVTSFYVW